MRMFIRERNAFGSRLMFIFLPGVVFEEWNSKSELNDRPDQRHPLNRPHAAPR